MMSVLLVAATERELGGNDGLACGIGPVEAAAATARALSERGWGAVLHVGIAGGRGLATGSLVIGSEAVYCDLAAAIPLVDRVPADPALLVAAQRALPGAHVLPIGTSAAVGGVDSRSPGRGDGGVRRAPRSGACRGPGARGPGDLERDRRAGSRSLGDRSRDRRVVADDAGAARADQSSLMRTATSRSSFAVPL